MKEGHLILSKKKTKDNIEYQAFLFSDLFILSKVKTSLNLFSSENSFNLNINNHHVPQSPVVNFQNNNNNNNINERYKIVIELPLKECRVVVVADDEGLRKFYEIFFFFGNFFFFFGNFFFVLKFFFYSPKKRFYD